MNQVRLVIIARVRRDRAPRQPRVRTRHAERSLKASNAKKLLWRQPHAIAEQHLHSASADSGVSSEMTHRHHVATPLRNVDQSWENFIAGGDACGSFRQSGDDSGVTT